MISLLLRVFTASLVPLSAQAQDSLASVVPQIAVVGRADVKVSPDRATIQISVQTRASTAQAAATENAVKQQSVITALKTLGLSGDQISTINYSVNPEQRYEEGKEPVVVAYTVTNTILVDAQKLGQVGPIIDSALSHGANMISSLQFYASNAALARRNAIAGAIENARADAEAAARAAQGSLGGLLELEIGPASVPPPRPMAMIRAESVAAATPINPGEQTVSVEVSTRWRFVPRQ
jgi:uncharacterized protein YggE